MGRRCGRETEFRERQLDLKGQFFQWCGNLMQWRLPQIYEDDLNDDS